MNESYSSGAFLNHLLHILWFVLKLFMKQLFILITLFFTLILKCGFSQVNIRIYIRDTSHKPLQAATVVIQDSVHLYSGISDSFGCVVLHLPAPGQYSAHISMLGYRSLDSTLQVEEQMHDLHFVLQPSSRQLSEVVVRTTNISISQDAEKFIVHFVNPHFVEGRSVWDVMKTSPLINIDANDNLSVIGNQQVVIYINGRRQYLGLQDLVEILKSRPADDIEQLEIIPMPTAQYNAPEGAAVINIVFKKMFDYTKGYVNTTEIYQSLLTEKLGAGLSHQKGKWGYDINISGDISRQKSLFESNLSVPSKQIAWSEHDTTVVRKFPHLFMEMEVSYRPGKHREIFLYNSTPIGYENPSDMDFVSWVRFNMNQADGGDFTRLSRKEKIRYFKSNTVMEYIFNPPDRQQKLDVIIGHVYAWNYTNYLYDFRKFIHENLNSQTLYSQDLPRLSNTVFGRVQYGWLLGKKLHADVGFQYIHTYSRTNSTWTDYTSGTGRSIDSLNILYQLPEAIYEGFVNLKMPFSNKFVAVASIRASHTDDDGKLYGKEIYGKHYNNFVPTIQLNYNPSAKHQFGYSMQSGVDRPSFWANAPIFTYGSAKEIEQNNPQLTKSTYLNMIFSYIYNQKHVWRIIGSFEDHAIVSATNHAIIDEKGNLITSPTNIKYFDVISLEYSSNFSFFNDFWNLNPYAAIAYAVSRGMDSTAFLNNRSFYSLLKVNNQLTISRSQSWYAQVYTYLLTPVSIYFAKLKYPTFVLSISLMKYWKKWQLQLSANDLTNSQKHQLSQLIFENPENSVESHLYPLMPSFQIRLTYRFGNQKINNSGANKESLNEIEKRT